VDGAAGCEGFVFASGLLGVLSDALCDSGQLCWAAHLLISPVEILSKSVANRAGRPVSFFLPLDSAALTIRAGRADLSRIRRAAHVLAPSSVLRRIRMISSHSWDLRWLM